MTEKITSKVATGGHKDMKTILHTPFGDVEVKTNVNGYKSSEGDKKFEKPNGKERR